MTRPGGISLPLGLAVCTAIFLRVAVVVITRHAEPLIDMVEYHQLAVSMLEGRGYAAGNGPTAFREPLYPAFLAAVYRLVGDPSVMAARLVQAGLGGLDAYLAFHAARMLGWGGYALPAAWIVACYPDRILYATYLHREAILGPLWLLQLIAFSRLWGTGGGIGRAVVAGVTVAAGALCNAVLLVTSAAHSVVLLAHPSRRRTVAVVAVWLTAAAIVAPWGYRNLRTLGHWVWLDTKGGNALWEGNNEGWLQGEAEMTIRRAQWDQMEGMSEVEADRFARAQALRFIRAHPGQFLHLWWRKSLQFWRLELLSLFYYKQGYWGDLPRGVLAAAAAVLLPVFPLVVIGAAAGTVIAWRDRGVRVAVFLTLAHCAACSVFIGGFRYHYPVVPTLAALAAMGWRSRAKLRGPVLAAWSLIALAFCFNFADHVAANWEQVLALLGRGGKLDYSDTRSWMKKGLF
ncbi:MAG: glycosyltransferase family 39 protein [Candidatus Eisenbacteria bacterium]|jgi:hypothetical protein|nr:glycosyltransferase family 39 protein [Candidatus Eisenbacteria bacterium]